MPPKGALKPSLWEGDPGAGGGFCQVSVTWEPPRSRPRPARPLCALRTLGSGTVPQLRVFRQRNDGQASLRLSPKPKSGVKVPFLSPVKGPSMLPPWTSL